ncbi:MAG: hypothetical protein BLM47_10350 [Candidatus Reconcilbacillus cellulovorans]|uniref:Uncharacterized protein n=1 Tax=Candidatus Reconcilbacillus cellulovorans TaxID=1906605 RepID=A0A2A6DY77_9BACL|nr:MAG: hypothetical protein BLM47_10350 [Candidatus Reconcilbacillus cellulovorans]
MRASICSVCNGLRPLHAVCPACGAEAVDSGRADEYWGPYAPYLPIDDLKMTNGLPDLARRECAHLARCPRCGTVSTVFVRERAWPPEDD